MRLNMNHAKEFATALGKPNLKPETMDSNGNFVFGFKGADADSQVIVDPGIVAGLIQLKKSVEKGSAPEDELKSQIARICSELNI